MMNVSLARPLRPLPSTLPWDKEQGGQAIPSQGQFTFAIIEGEPLLNAFQTLQMHTQAQSPGSSHPFHPLVPHILFTHQYNNQTKENPGQRGHSAAVECHVTRAELSRGLGVSNHKTDGISKSGKLNARREFIRDPLMGCVISRA